MKMSGACSKLFTANFRIIPANFVRNSLHVCMEKNDSKRLRVQENEKEVIVGIVSKSLPENSDRVLLQNDLYVYVQIMDVSDSSISSKAASSDESLTFYCTKLFLDHYKFRLETQIQFRTVNVFPLRRVVLGIESEEVFCWASKQFFSTGLLLSVCDDKVLIRKGDVFLGPHNSIFSRDDNFSVSFYFKIKVLESEPLNQGILGVNTELILTKTHSINPKNTEEIQSADSKGRNKVLSPMISEFTRGLYPTDFKKAFDEGDHIEGTVKTESQLYNIKVVKRNKDWMQILGKVYENRFDPLKCIVLNKSTATGAGVFHNSFIQLKIHSHKTADTTKLVLKTALVKVVNNESLDTCIDNTVYVTPHLLFNLNQQHESCSEESFVLFEDLSSSVHEGSDSSISPSWKINVPYAKEVQLALVNAPNNSVAKSFDGAVKKYFNKPRALCLNEIIAIPTREDPAFLPTSQDSFDDKYPVLYFKVSKMTARHSSWDVQLVDTNHSAVTLVGLTHSFVPVAMTTFWSNDSGTDFWQTSTLPGMETYTSELNEIIVPYLTKRDASLDSAVPTILLEGCSGIGKTTVTKATAAQFNIHLCQVQCYDLCGESSAATEARIRNAIQNAAMFAPCILLLKDIHALGKDRDGNAEDTRVTHSFKQILQSVSSTLNEWPFIIIATTSSGRRVSMEIRDSFLHEIIMEPPNENERHQMLSSLLEKDDCSVNIDYHHIAQRTAGLVLGDLCALVSHTRRAGYLRVLEVCSGGRMLTVDEESDIVAAGLNIRQIDVDVALEQLQAAHSDSIGAPKIPNVSWEDIGGLTDIKSEILDTIQLPLEHPELFAAGLRRSGVLLYGPPGTGKTLLAKAVATECSLNFLSVKGPELINMYVGQSEENVREVFQRARNATPCVIFFDELDSLAPNRGRSGDSGGVMDRVVSQLLAELDGLHKSCDIFVIGATNRPDLLDPALLRPGRFDKLLYLGVNEDKSSQLKILKALTRKFQLADGASLDNIVKECPGNLTGADFYALCSDAMLNAMKRKIDSLEKGIDVDQTKVVVSEEDFIVARNNLVPSVSQAELRGYKDVQAKFNVKR